MNFLWSYCRYLFDWFYDWKGDKTFIHKWMICHFYIHHIFLPEMITRKLNYIPRLVLLHEQKMLEEFTISSWCLELRQYKNYSIQSKIIPNLKLLGFFTLYGKGKSAAISKLDYVYRQHTNSKFTALAFSKLDLPG